MKGPLTAIATAIVIFCALCLAQTGAAQPGFARSETSRTAAAERDSYLTAGKWSGFTKGGQKVRFSVTVPGIGITSFRSKLGVNCYFGKYVDRFEYPLNGQKKNRVVPFDTGGNFGVVFRGAGRASLKDNTRTLRGSLEGRRITGSIRVEGICRGKTSFSASPVDSGLPPLLPPKKSAAGA